MPYVVIVFALFMFAMAAKLSNISMDQRWQRHENHMLARGIHVVRTPQWEKIAEQQAKYEVPIVSGMGVLLLIFAWFVFYIQEQIHQPATSYSPITINGIRMTMDDYEACGSNPPMGCPPNIARKYSSPK